jgi:integrase
MSQSTILPFLEEKVAQKFIDKYPFLTYPETQKWLNALNVKTKGKHGFSDENFRQVISRLSRYLTFVGLNPKDLIDEVEADSNKPKREQTNPTANRLTAYLRSLSMAPKTISANIHTIKGFYKHNGFKIDMFVPKGENSKDKVPMTKDLIKQCIILAPHLREKVIMLIMASSGMSITDVLDLEYKHIQADYEAGTTPLLIEFSRTKNGNGYKTFLSTECVGLLREYLRDRPMLPDEKLFDVTYKSFSATLRSISFKVLQTNQLNSKAFRRFFNNTLKMAGVNDTIVEYWMGHSLPTKKEYLEPELLRGVYKEKENEVTILTTVIREQATELRSEYETRIADLEKIVKGLEKVITAFNMKTAADPDE